MRRKLDLVRLDWPLRRGPRFRMCRSLTEAAQVSSRHLTEPMRGGRRRPQLAPLSMRRSLAVSRSRQDRGGNHVYPISPRKTPPLAQRASGVEGAQERDRADRIAWPAPGTERFLGRDISKQTAQAASSEVFLLPLLTAPAHWLSPSSHGNVRGPDPV